MSLDIVLWLLQDAITNGAVYVLLALAVVLVFTVTRVIFIPQGAFISFAALTLATLQSGKVPGTAYLVVAGGILVLLVDALAAFREQSKGRLLRLLCIYLLLPLAVAGLSRWSAARPELGWLHIVLSLLMVTLMGPMLYRLAFQPIANASVLVLLIVAVAMYFVLSGLCLMFFGGEGLRSEPLSTSNFSLGVLNISGQSLWVVFTSLALIVILWLAFERTLLGKQLRATAVSRVGARLVGISTEFSGQLSFTLAALIAAISGVLISPITTIYYDTGFLIGLKGFIGATIGGMVSYPLAAAGSLLVGLLEAGSSFWWSAYKDSIIFTLIIPVLLWRSLRTHHIEEDDEQ